MQLKGESEAGRTHRPWVFYEFEIPCVHVIMLMNDIFMDICYKSHNDVQSTVGTLRTSIYRMYNSIGTI